MSIQTLIPLVLKVSIVLCVFGLGLTASVRDASYLFRHPGKLFRALLAMGVLMPAVAVAMVVIFDLHPAVEIALVALSVSPIPPLLPKKAMKAGGTGQYTIGLLTAAALVAIVWVPTTTEIFAHLFGIPLKMTMASTAVLICLTVLGPMGLGIAVHTLAPALGRRLARPISLIGTVLLAVCALPVLFAAMPQVLSLIGNGTLLALVAFVVLGLAIGHLLGGEDISNRTVLALSTASRHPGVAIGIAHANFPQQKLAMAAVILYLLVSVIVSVPYLRWIRSHYPSVQSEVSGG